TVPSYSASAKVLIHNGNLNEINATNGAETKISAVDTVLEILNSQDIYIYLKSSVFTDLNYSEEELNDIVKVTAEGKDSLIFYVTATTDNPDSSLRITREYANMIFSYLSAYSQNVAVNVLYTDSAATKNIPDITLIVIISLIAGALLGILATVILSLSNRRLKGSADFKARYSVKVLGVVPNFEAERGKE
ncbi:MAG: hypothetical protein J6V50_03840, partial [Clostridia bacterium]|nr:hypothetical protein [Clostridia bacterium]